MLLAGVNDVHLKALARLGDLRVILRNDQLILSGDVEAVERCTPVAQRMVRMAQLTRSFDLADVERRLETVGQEHAAGKLVEHDGVLVELGAMDLIGRILAQNIVPGLGR